MSQELSELIGYAYQHAANQGLTQKDLAKRAKLTEVALSRLKSASDVKYSTLSSIGQAIGLKLIWVEDSSLAEHVTRGDLFQ